MMMWFSLTPDKRARKQQGEREGGRDRAKEGGTQKRVHPSFVLGILYMSVSCSTDTDIKTIVTHWYKVDVTGYMSFSGRFFSPRTARRCSKNNRENLKNYTRMRCTNYASSVAA